VQHFYYSSIPNGSMWTVGCTDSSAYWLSRTKKKKHILSAWDLTA